MHGKRQTENKCHIRLSCPVFFGASFREAPEGTGQNYKRMFGTYMAA